MKGAVHSIETFGSVDGPGIRYIIFLQGCNMRCRYCHNVDTWAPKREDTQFLDADELLDKAERYKTYWGNDGGITVSGGEALLQIDFLLELFAKAKKRGINTCIDTALQPFTRQEPFFSKFEELMKVTDLLLVDIKHIEPEAHKDLTANDNANILDGMRYLSDINKPIWIRHVLVPGITDDDEALRKTRAFIETLGNVQKIEVLPYHNLGVYKFKELGIKYTLEGTPAPSKERVENAEKILRGQI